MIATIYALLITLLCGNSPPQDQLLLQEIEREQCKVSELQAKLSKKNTYTVQVTAYTPSKDETDSTPSLTALNKKSRPGRTAAVGPNLRHLLGKMIYVPGKGTWHITDIKKRDGLDLMLPSKREAKEFGSKTLTIIVLEK